MKTKQELQQPSQTNASGQIKQSSNLIERKQIEGTPFTMITQTMDNDKHQYFIVMGDHRLTEPTNTEEETLEKIITEHWKIITNVICIIVEKMRNPNVNYYHNDAIKQALAGYRDGSYTDQDAINIIQQKPYGKELDNNGNDKYRSES